ncbi:unnamed protein product [Rotaria socialis]|uniref:EGF-like domain-containing protein n=3 Tax=Rotaria socialis TaxID=392032 RepID=A0A818M6I3_9BILA|nr:unnamed protein product [Rotaria socialis]
MIFCNCSLSSFGSRCQYTFNSALAIHSFGDFVRVTFKNRNQLREKLLVHTCYPYLSECNRGLHRCVSIGVKFVTKMDCIGESFGLDEQQCDQLEMNECGTNEYRCHNGAQCIPLDFVRDGKDIIDCLDGTDELEIDIQPDIEMPITEDAIIRCISITVFQCEEATCCFPRTVVSGDGECVRYGNIPTLGRPCIGTGRDLNSTRALFTSFDPLSPDCRKALFYALKLYYYFNNIHSEKRCSSDIQLSVANNCAQEYVWFSTQPILYGYFQFVYITNRSVNVLEYNIAPYLVCNDPRQCLHLPKKKIQMNGRDCRPYWQFFQKPLIIRRSKTALRTCSNSSSSSSLSSLQSMSQSSSSSSTISTDSVSSDLNSLSLNNTSTIPTSASSSSFEMNHLPQPSAITVIKSIRSKDQLFMEGYTYQCNVIRKHEIRWTCKEKHNKKSPCRTAINTTKNSATEQNPIYSFASSNSVAHNHHPDEDNQVILTFRSRLKEFGEANRSAPPTKLYNILTTDMKLSDKQMGMLTRSEVLRKTIYNIRLKTAPPLPRDITFDIPSQFRITSADKSFLLYDHLYSKNTKRILLFSSEFLIRKMCSSSLLSMDGTFSVVPKMFKQLYIIVAIDEATHSAEPVAWILLSDKHAQTYILIFKAMKKAASRLKLELKPERFITDYESGIIKAVREEVGRCFSS